jgi:hypothetical protein
MTMFKNLSDTALDGFKGVFVLIIWYRVEIEVIAT